MDEFISFSLVKDIFPDLISMLSSNLFEREPIKPPPRPAGISGTALDNEDPILHPAWPVLQVLCLVVV